jgi:hypothetical protein
MSATEVNKSYGILTNMFLKDAFDIGKIYDS